MLKVVIADDHRLVREGVSKLLESAADIDVVGQASGGVEALELTRTLEPDVLLLDVTMEGIDGLETLQACRKAAGPPVLMLSMHEDRALIKRALDLGAAGYLSKQAAGSEMIAAVRAVASGESFLCARTRALLAAR